MPRRLAAICVLPGLTLWWVACSQESAPECGVDTDCAPCYSCVLQKCFPAQELCFDGKDNDCDGITDEDCHCDTPCTQECCEWGTVCYEDACCTPLTCQELNRRCGTIADGCGQDLDCGDCLPDQSCTFQGYCDYGQKHKLDPDEVYLLGTLSEGSCSLDVLVHWSTPDTPMSGFDCYSDHKSAVVRPSDGRLLYMLTTESTLREFHCDLCPLDPGQDYPQDVLINDSIVPTPPCDPEMDGLSSFLVAADGGALHRCGSDEHTWYDSEGNLVYNGEPLLMQLGSDNLALAIHPPYEDHVLVNLVDGQTTTVVGAPEMRTLVTSRHLPLSGFWMVLTGELSDDPLELWSVDSAGNATEEGSYPPPPEGLEIGHTSALDAGGFLYQLAKQGTLQDVVFRRSIFGTSEVVYTEADDPRVKLHSGGLITGP